MDETQKELKMIPHEDNLLCLLNYAVPMGIKVYFRDDLIILKQKTSIGFVEERIKNDLDFFRDIMEYDIPEDGGIYDELHLKCGRQGWLSTRQLVNFADKLSDSNLLKCAIVDRYGGFDAYGNLNEPKNKAKIKEDYKLLETEMKKREKARYCINQFGHMLKISEGFSYEASDATQNIMGIAGFSSYIEKENERIKQSAMSAGYKFSKEPLYMLVKDKQQRKGFEQESGTEKADEGKVKTPDPVIYL